MHRSPTNPGRRVLHVISGLSTGGAETALLRLVQATAPLGWRHTVVSLTDEGTRAAPLRAAGATVYACGRRRFTTWWRSIRTLRSLARDADIVQGWMYHGNLAATLATVGRPHLRLILSVRSSLDSMASTSAPRRAVIRLGALVSSRADAVVYNSVRSAGQHETFGYASVHRVIIPNGFDVDRFVAAPAARELFRRTHRLGDDVRVVGLFARVAPEKDHETFLRAMVHVCSHEPNVRVLLAGRGTENDEALGPLVHDATLANRLIRLGDVADAASFYPACDVTVLSSIREGFPNVLAESMACGVPCVATDVGDVAMIVGDTGVVVPTHAPRALADAVFGLLQETGAQRVDRAVRARQRIVTHFSAERMRDAYLELWTRLASDDHRADRFSRHQEAA